MKKQVQIALLAGLILALSISAGQAGISRVAKRINVIDFYGGSSLITGEYDGLGSDSWQDIFQTNLASPQVKGEDLYETAFHLGLSYGQLRGRFLYAFGIRYTKVKFPDATIIPFDDPGYVYMVQGLEQDFDVSLFDIGFDVNYLLADLQKTGLAPYLGLGFKTGFMTFGTDGRAPDGLAFDSESQLKFTFSVNFGADLKIWSASAGRSFVTLSSINSWDFIGSSNRPKYLNLGGGIRYFFRP